MIKSIRRTPSFKRDFKRIKKKHFDENLFVDALKALMLEDTQLLTLKYKDHALTGNWKGYRELHILQNWILIYRIDEDELQLVLTRTGTHDELF